jgi:hypothetical protein
MTDRRDLPYEWQKKWMKMNSGKNSKSYAKKIKNIACKDLL